MKRRFIIIIVAAGLMLFGSYPPRANACSVCKFKSFEYSPGSTRPYFRGGIHDPSFVWECVCRENECSWQRKRA